MQSCIPIEELMLCCVFFFHNKNNNYTFYLALTHLKKFKRGQGQTSVISLAIKFYFFLKSSLQIVQGTTCTLGQLSGVPFFLIRTPLM